MRGPERGIAERIVSLLLRVLYPSVFHRDYAEQMRLAFHDQWHERRGDSWVARGALFTRTVTDLVRGALNAWFHSGGDLPGRRPERRARPGMGVAWLTSEVRLAIRSLRSAPGFALVTILTLGLGIGANAAVFTVMRGVLLRDLPYADPDRLVALRSTLRDRSWWSVSPGDIIDWTPRTQTLSGIASARGSNVTLVTDGTPVMAPAASVSPNLLDVLGVAPSLGRGFSVDDGVDGRVVILTHGAWLRRFAGDPSIVGGVLRIDGVGHTVIGVLPSGADLFFLGDNDMLIPRVSTPNDVANRGKTLRAVARMRDGVDLTAVRADMHRVAEEVEAAGLNWTRGWGIEVVPLHDEVVGQVRGVLSLLLGAVGLVLLVACANVGNLMLARGAARMRQLALRRALGADRWRLTTHILGEAALLAGAGGALGLAIAAVTIPVLLAIDPAALPRGENVSVDGIVLAYTAGLSVVVTILFGAIPAARLSRANAADVLREREVRTTASRRAAGRQHVLVAAELALVVMLLAGAGLALRGFGQLRAVDPGFPMDGRLAFRVSVPPGRYPDAESVARFSDSFLERLRAVPGVTQAGAITALPFQGPGSTAFHLVEGQPTPRAGEEPIGGMEGVSVGYLEALGTPLLEGRLLDGRDVAADVPPRVVINDVMASRFWEPGSSPLGDRVRSAPGPTAPAYEIVGVVRGVRYGLDAAVRPRFYIAANGFPFNPPSRDFLVVTSRDAPAALGPSLRRALAEIDPELAIADVRTLYDARNQSIARPRLQVVLLAAFAGLALVLGVVGVYGVVGYTVAQRRREMGIRLALGAGTTAVTGLVVRRAVVPAALGVVVGGVGAAWLGGILESFFIVPTNGLLAISAWVGLGMLLVTTLAAALPARRAGRVDPMVVLSGD